MHFPLILLFIVSPLLALPQDTLQFSPQITTGAFVQVDWENDAFQIRPKSISDRYYSNGIRIAHLNNYWQKWPTNYALLKLAPKDSRTYYPLYSFTIGQEIYTPKDTRTVGRPLYPNDRPYAGYLYASWGLTTTDPTGARRLTSSLTLGMIGPASGAAEVQEELHRFLGQFVPVGWGEQIKNDPVISYHVRYDVRAIPRFSSAVDIIGDIDATFGSLTNAAGMGGTVRLGLFNDCFQNPTGLYSGAGGTATRKVQCYAFIRVGFRGVLDNGLMQGGWLNGSKNYYALPAVELQHFYGQTDVGGVIAGKNVQFTFTQHVRTAEFVNALADQWGHFSLLFRVGR